MRRSNSHPSWLVLAAVLLLAACGGTEEEVPGNEEEDAGSVTGPTACEPGTQGCECVAGDRCGLTPQGEQLVCQGGVCEAVACLSGQTGCACRGGGSCDAPSDTCKGGLCVRSACTPGDKDCRCLAGSCKPGLTCLGGEVCVDSRGYEGGACLDTGRCHRGNRCDPATGRCVACEPGSAGCQCTAAGGCNLGLGCGAGVCVPAAQLPPVEAACYTPCLDDLEVDGGIVACTPNGVLPGCLPGQACVDGSCLKPGQEKPRCANDLECPFFQVCLSGGCYSNCEVNADCASGMGCFHHACRTSCKVAQGQEACPKGYACTADDGQNGYCTPVGGTSPSGPQALPTGGIQLPLVRLDLSNVKQTDSLVVLPRASITQDVTVRKLWHRVSYKDGTSERVDAPLDKQGQYRACDPVKNECPLWWLQLTVPDANKQPVTSQAPTAGYRLEPHCVDDLTRVPSSPGTPCPRVTVGNAAGVEAVRWEGELEVTTKDASGRVALSYVQRPEGRWVGSMFYFGSFNPTGVPEWSLQEDKTANPNGVENGLIQRWIALRAGGLPDGWGEFLAVLTSTNQESWKFGLVAERCLSATGNPLTACYPYSNTRGVRAYVQNTGAAPIPSGMTELPIAMNLRISQATPARFEGRVESSGAMHYPGNPAIKLEFAGNPAEPGACSTRGGGDCLVFLKGLTSSDVDVNRLVSTVGGRYLPGAGGCAAGYQRAEVPWLIPGLTGGTVAKEGTGERFRVECRDTELPFNPAGDSKRVALNMSLSGGNPVPDGNPRKRTLRFLDGALVNQSELFILFEESYASFIPGQPPTTAYGYMLLKRAGANLKPSDFEALPDTTVTRTPPVPAGAQCPASVLEGIPGTSVASVKVDVLLGGSARASGYVPDDTGIHYYCEDTGYFNGGPGDNGTASATRVACPAGSKVTYFRTGPTLDAAGIAGQACQRTVGADGRARCHDTLQGWLSEHKVVVEAEPVYTCKDGGVFCDDNRFDLRQGKSFYRRSATSTARNLMPLRPLIDAAFRYKTRFRSTTHGTLGFAPTQCVPGSDSTPYCYDPAQLEEARARVDCLLNIYSNRAEWSGLPAATRTQVVTFLRQSFSTFPQSYEGFERLYSELLIMQGDEALTAAYASRFDLAAAGGASFRGSAFEPNGIDLTGVAGAEMYRLYEAVQYYQLALDRLYLLGPDMHVALGERGGVGGGESFVTPEMVTSYLERLIRAASQKARAWSEVARRYQNFNRPDLARAVVERAYVGTYLESALISRLMQDIADKSSSASQAQLRQVIEKAQRSYRMALLDMREVYGRITDEVNYFGYPAQYIPFPVMDGNSVTVSNAYDALALLARQRLELARTREQTALASGRQGRVDTAQFQSDLTSIRNNYENQLAQLCGVFTGADGNVYPAIRKYAHQSTLATLMGDPCGRMGNGDIHNAMGAVEDTTLRLRGAILRHGNIDKEIEVERTRVAEQCGLINQVADFQYSRAGHVASVQQKMAATRATMNLLTTSATTAMQGMATAKCEINCAMSSAMAANVTLVGIAAATATFVTEVSLSQVEKELREFEADTVHAVQLSQCTAQQIDSRARVAGLFANALEAELEALRADYSMRLALAEVSRLFGNGQRIQAQQEEAEQLAVDIQAAQNDPNVRIYQNDAVINADVSFQDALALAYRLTRVYEYYTSQSYAKKEQLFLIRMVGAGQYNLENYLLELDNAFNAFEEQFGNPDLRVMVLSLRDDVLRIPYLSVSGAPLTESERSTMMRERLKDVRLLDSRGYLTLPFSTHFKALSPLTRNHKIRHVEVDLQGAKMGDPVARVYLRMAGTGQVRNLEDDVDFYVFPERTAVVNASLLGAKVYDPEVYRNQRFRDRPLVNTQWELVINQRDELANQDIDLQSLTDIRVVIYYSDFTTL